MVAMKGLGCNHARKHEALPLIGDSRCFFWVGRVRILQAGGLPRDQRVLPVIDACAKV